MKEVDTLPTLSMFYGIVIRMNWKDIGQHNDPHFHAFYGEFEASFNLDGEVIAGSFPGRQAAFVHEDELLANWTLAANGEEVFRIDPLK